MVLCEGNPSVMLTLDFFVVVLNKLFNKQSISVDLRRRDSHVSVIGMAVADQLESSWHQGICDCHVGVWSHQIIVLALLRSSQVTWSFAWLTLTSRWRDLSVKSSEIIDFRLFVQRLVHEKNPQTNKENISALHYWPFIKVIYTKPFTTKIISDMEGNPPVTGGIPTQRPSNEESVPVWWRHHVQRMTVSH